MKRLSLLIPSLLVLAMPSFAARGAATEYIGMFLQGQRIGYMTTTVHNEPEGRRSVTGTFFNTQLIGAGMKITLLSEAWSDRQGRLKKQTYSIESAGRRQMVVAVFGEEKVVITRESEGVKDERELAIPEGAVIVDDATFGAFGKGVPEPGETQTFYALDPMALVLIRSVAEFKGETEIEVEGVTHKALRLHVTDPRSTSDFYVKPDGSLILATTVFGITMRPITRDEALSESEVPPILDLALVTSVQPDKAIPNPRNVKRLVLELEGRPLERLVSDSHQTVSRDGDVTRLEIHPQWPEAEQALPIAALKGAQPEFSGPGLYIPAEDRTMINLAGEILAGETNSRLAAVKISDYVNRIMKPNASIGLLRDAGEILRTKEGVCRDYAILTAALMRAAGIPTKVVTGSVYGDGAFYYHAWVEAWTGRAWLPLDPTLTGGRFVDATHIKFAEGNPDQAFVTFTLDGVKIRVVEVVRR